MTKVHPLIIIGINPAVLLEHVEGDRGTAELIPIMMNGGCWSVGPGRRSKPWRRPPGWTPIAFYVLEKDGRVVDPNDDQWMHLRYQAFISS